MRSAIHRNWQTFSLERLKASFLIDFSFSISLYSQLNYFLLNFYAFLKTRTCVNSKLYPLKSAGASRSGPVTTCRSRDPEDQSQHRVKRTRTNHVTDWRTKRRYLTKVATIYEIMLVLNTTEKQFRVQTKIVFLKIIK